MRNSRAGNHQIVRFIIAALFSVGTCLGLWFPAISKADPVKITVPGVGAVTVTQREKPPTQNDPHHKQSVTIKRPSSGGAVKVVKTIPGTGLGVAGVASVEVDTDADTVKDSTEVTITVPSGGAGSSTTVTYKTNQSLEGQSDKIVVTSGGQTTPGTQGKIQSGTEGKGKAEKLPDGPPNKSQGQSIQYNPTTATLSFANDFIVETGFPGDPLVGSAVDLPDFQFDGFSLDGTFAEFTVLTDDFFTIHQSSNTYLMASMDFLFYNLNTNQFVGDFFDLSISGVGPSSPFYNPALAPLSSPGLLLFEQFMNPSSPNFNPFAIPFFTFTPDANFLNLTGRFTVEGVSHGTNLIFPGQNVPEPSTLLLLASGLAGLAAWQRNDRKE